MAKQANPGAPEGTELIMIGDLYGGWVSTAAGVNSAPHYVASIEGNEGSLAKPNAGNYAESDGVTMFRKERMGHLAPALVWTPISDSGVEITDLPLNGAVHTSGDSYVVLKNGRLVRITSLGLTTGGTYDPMLAHRSGAADHSTHSVASTQNPDVVIMYDQASPQKEWVLWSWTDNTDGDINIRDTAGDLVYESWYSHLNGAVALNVGVPLKIIRGPDGNIYITNGSTVEQVLIGAGSALTAATKGLTLPLGADWTATGLVSYKNYVAIIAYKTSVYNTSQTVARGDCSVFLWDGLDSVSPLGVVSIAPDFIFPIPDNYANGIFFDGDVLYAVTNGRNNSSKIFEFTGKGFKKVFETPLIAPSPTAVQGSMESYQDSLMIGAVKGSYGHVFRFYGGGFHDEGVITDGTNPATAVGMVKNLYLDTIFAGVKFGSTYSIYYTNGNFQTGCQLRTVLFMEGILGRRMYPLGFQGSVNRIYLYLSQWGTGASLYLSLFKDYTTANPGKTGDLLNVLIDTDSATPNGYQSGTNYFGGAGYIHYAYPVGTTEIDISDIAINDISTFYMILTFSHASITNTAAIIRRMIVFVSPSQ